MIQPERPDAHFLPGQGDFRELVQELPRRIEQPDPGFGVRSRVGEIHDLDGQVVPGDRLLVIAVNHPRRTGRRNGSAPFVQILAVDQQQRVSVDRGGLELRMLNIIVPGRDADPVGIVRQRRLPVVPKRAGIQKRPVKGGAETDVTDRDAADQHAVRTLLLQRGAAVGEPLLHLFREKSVAAEVVERFKPVQHLPEPGRIVPHGSLVHRLSDIVSVESALRQLLPQGEPLLRLLAGDVVHENHHFPVDPAGVRVIFVGSDKPAEMLEQIVVRVIQPVDAERDLERGSLRIAEETRQGRHIGSRIDHVDAETVETVGAGRIDLFPGAEKDAGIPLQIPAEQCAVVERMQHPLRRKRSLVVTVALVEAPADVVRPAHFFLPRVSAGIRRCPGQQQKKKQQTKQIHERYPPILRWGCHQMDSRKTSRGSIVNRCGSDGSGESAASSSRAAYSPNSS